MARKKLRYRYAALDLDWLARKLADADRGGSIDSEGKITITLTPAESKEVRISLKMGASLLTEAERKEQQDVAEKNRRR